MERTRLECCIKLMTASCRVGYIARSEIIRRNKKKGSNDIRLAGFLLITGFAESKNFNYLVDILLLLKKSCSVDASSPQDDLQLADRQATNLIWSELRLGLALLCLLCTLVKLANLLSELRIHRMALEHDLAITDQDNVGNASDAQLGLQGHIRRARR